MNAFPIEAASLVSCCRRVMLCLACWLLSMHSASAVDSLTGTVVSVDATGGRMVVKDRAKMTNRSFQVGKSAQISLDGKTVLLNRVEAGQTVTVFYTATIASRLLVRSEKKETPEQTNKPESNPNSKPEPKPTPGSKTPAKTSVSRADVSDSWNQFRGPNRDNISRETGLLRQWPQDGPSQGWTAVGIGEGYSSVSISNGKVFTMGNQDDEEKVFALDLATGNVLWSARSGRAYREGQGNGPRGTPTIDRDRVYGLGANGDLVCLDIDSGKQRWHVNILQRFGGENITWGISESVLIDGDKLICTPGGRDATMVALNKMTGEPIWRSQVPSSPRAAYSSAIAVDVGGVRQYVNFTHEGVVGVRASDGTPLWGKRESANPTANCSSPLFANNSVFTASGYNTGGALFRLASRNGQTAADTAYSTRDMQNHHGGMVLHDGHVYGCNNSILVCMNLNTGKPVWQDRSVGKGSLTMADGCLYVRGENGSIALVEATPRGYQELGRFDQPQRSGNPSWAHPVVAEGRLFLRDMNRLLTYDVKK